MILKVEKVKKPRNKHSSRNITIQLPDQADVIKFKNFCFERQTTAPKVVRALIQALVSGSIFLETYEVKNGIEHGRDEAKAGG